MHTLLIALGLTFSAAIVLVGYSIYVIWRDQLGKNARVFARRLESIARNKTVATGNASILKQAAQSEFAQVPKTGMLADAVWLLRHAGLNWSLSRFGLYSVTGALAGAIIGGVAGLPLSACLALLCGGALVPWLIVRRLSGKRAAKMEQQLPDTLDMINGMLRAGHTLPTALALLSQQLPAPLGEEFGVLYGEMTYGSSAEEALNHFIERTHSEDIRCLVMAILMQKETGGNLSDVLEGLSGVIRERLKLRGKIRSLSMEGRMSAVVLTALPLAVGAAIYAINPGYLNFFWIDPTGNKMLYVMLIMLLLGNLWMRKLIRIRV